MDEVPQLRRRHVKAVHHALKATKPLKPNFTIIKLVQII